MRERNLADFDCSYAQALPPHKHSKLVKLVANRPLVNYSLNDKMFGGLWDTGSMISLISKTWLDFEFPKQSVYPIESFIGAGEGQFSLKAANNSEIYIEGIVLFDFGISNHDNPIIGYNIIEHIVTNIPDQKHNPVLTKNDSET